MVQSFKFSHRMRRNWIKINRHQPKQHSSSLSRLISQISISTSSNLSRQSTVYNTFNRSINTSSPDQLEGLIDSHFNPPESNLDPPSDCRSAVNLDEEFAILRRSLSVEKFDSCKFSDAYIICKAIRDNNKDFGDKTQKFLSKFREKLSESLVVDVLKLLQNADLGVKFFIWAGRQIGYNHTLPVYDTLLDIMGCNNADRIPDHFLREIRDDDDKEVLGKLLNVLIRKYCQNGSWNSALEELARLKDFGYKPSRVTYNALIQVFLEANNLDTANLVYNEMADAGYKMDPHTLGSFAYSLCKFRKWREALEMINKEKFALDTTLYTRMIGGLCEGSLFEEAMEFLNRMRCDSCMPNVLTYRTLLCGYLNKGKLGRCKRILSMMIAEGCYPSPKIYNSLVHAYCKSGDFTYAYKLLKETGKYGVRPNPVIFNIFIGAICGTNEILSADKLELAEMAYGQMLEGGFVLNKVNVSNYARCLCEAEKFERAYNVINEMMSKGFVPDESTYSNVISFLCNASKLEKAFWLFKEMKKNKVVPNVHTYTILIDGFCKAGLTLQGRKFFDEMVANGCSPNVVTYTVLIHAYLKAKKVSDANKLFETMLSCGISPNVVTITALIDGYSKVGEVEKASEIYSRMKGNKEKENLDVEIYSRIKGNQEKENLDVEIYSRMKGNQEKENLDVEIYSRMKGNQEKENLDVEIYSRMKGNQEKENLDVGMYFSGKKIGSLEPNVVTYGALVDGLCKANKVKEARGLLDVMNLEGCEPNNIVYDALIDGLLKSGKLEEAEEVYSRMCEHGYNPSVFTYGSMIDKMFKDNRLDLATRVLSKMLENSCPPNVIIYTEMVDGLCKVGKTDEAYKLMEMMETKGCKPNVVTYTAMINGFGKLGKVEKSLEIFKEMGRKSCAPNYVTYSVLIHHCCNFGFLDEALELLKEMKMTYWPMHMASYCKVIEGFNREFLINLGVLDGLSEFDSIPVIPVYKLLLDGYRKAGKLEVALELFKEMRELSSLMDNKDLYFSLIESLSASNRVDEAFELYADLISNGGVPELSVVVNLVKGLVKVNRWEDALQLSWSLCYMDLRWLPYDDKK